MSNGKGVIILDLSNYATKTDIKNISHVDTSRFELKLNLAGLKAEVEKLDIDKLVAVPVDLSKLSDVLKNDVVKKTVYDKLVAKINNIDTSGFVLKTKYDTDKSELENKIADTRSLVKKTDYNTKITEIENKMQDVSSLATKTLLTIVENKIPDVSNLVKKTDYNTKTTEIENKLNNHNHDKYITTPEFNTLVADVFNARLARANLVAKENVDNAVSSLDSRTAANKAKNESIENELRKLKTLDLSYFIGKSHFEEDGTQNYLVFQSLKKYLKKITNTKYILSWQSEGLSDEIIKSPATSDTSLTPLIDYVGNKISLKTSGSCLKQSKLQYTHGIIVNIYVVYELGVSGSNNKNLFIWCSYFD